MNFSLEQEKRKGFDRALHYLSPEGATPETVKRIEQLLEGLIELYGPVVDSYPIWHPLVSQNSRGWGNSVPSRMCGYKGLDHNIFLANAIITCPYGDRNTKDIIESVEALAGNDIAEIKAEELDAVLYHEHAHPVIIRCEWHEPINNDGSIPKNLAIPLILEREIPAWRWAERAEDWDSMHQCFMGRPCDNTSSLFIDKDTGEALKEIWNRLIDTGMYGPIR